MAFYKGQTITVAELNNTNKHFAVTREFSRSSDWELYCRNSSGVMVKFQQPYGGAIGRVFVFKKEGSKWVIKGFLRAENAGFDSLGVGWYRFGASITGGKIKISAYVSQHPNNRGQYLKRYKIGTPYTEHTGTSITTSLLNNGRIGT